MIKRLISSILLIAILFTSIYFAKGNALATIFLLLSIAGIHEFALILQNMGIIVSKLGLQTANFALVATSIYTASQGNNLLAIVIPVVIFLLISFAFALGTFRDITNQKLRRNAIASIMTLVALSLPISLFAVVSLLTPSSFALVIWVMFATKFTDIGGYLFGICLGNHKIAPSISPAKSWEGLAGGLLSSFVIGTFAIVAFKGLFPESFTLLHAGIWAVIIGFLGFLSDLLESAFKRCAKVKDSGATIPGIGGVLDLLDSMLINAPIALVIALLYW
ncbi:MAG: phosphatidate cytidylyltransferase [Opitutales bacterium]